MKPLYSFLVALQFLTRFPVRLPPISDTRILAGSLFYYPLVGLLLGLVLAALHILLADTPATMRAVLVLIAWVVLTGALHLDGLGDSADAWVGGLGNRERTLAIMKDPHCGPAAVVALVLTLLAKFAALSSLPASEWLPLAAIPMLARGVMPLLFATTPYVRPGGLGAALATHSSRTPGIVAYAATGIVAVVAAGVAGAWLVLILSGAFLLLRGMMMRRLGGTTGDTAGALIELGEAAMLVTLALL